MARRRRQFGRLDPWTGFLAQIGFILDCQAVVGLRLLRLAEGGHAGAREARRMVTEKAATFAGAQLAAAAAMPRYGLPGAALAVEQRYRRAVARNRRRLSDNQDGRG